MGVIVVVVVVATVVVSAHVTNGVHELILSDHAITVAQSLVNIADEVGGSANFIRIDKVGERLQCPDEGCGKRIFLEQSLGVLRQPFECRLKFAGGDRLALVTVHI